MITVAMLQEFYSLFHGKEKSRYYGNKGYDYYLLPKAGDELVTADDKLEQVLARHYNELLGCNHMRATDFTRLFWYQTLAFMKNQLIETGVRDCFHRIKDFIETNDLMETFNQDIPQQRDLLTLLPAVQVAYNNANELQLAFDRYSEEE